MLSTYQFPPPKNWQDFENLSYDLWRAIWKDPNTQKNGRQGQPQNGVDVFGQPGQATAWAGVQCKGKDNYSDKNVTEAELRKEVDKAKSFTPPLKEFTLATTGPRDSTIQEIARSITEDHHKHGLFSVQVRFWEDILIDLDSYPDLVAKYYPDYATTSTLRQGFDQLAQGQRDLFKAQSESQQETVNRVSEVKEAVESSISSLPTTLVSQFLSPFHEKTLDFARNLINTHKSAQALEYLEAQRSILWSQASGEIKSRFLMLMGIAKYSCGSEQEAATLFLEASQHNPTDEKVLCNAALGFMLLGKRQDAYTIASDLWKKNPTLFRAYSIAIQSSSSSFDEIVQQVPEYCRSNAEVACALAFVSSAAGNLEQAEHWYRIALENDKENWPDLRAFLAQTLLQRLVGNKTSPVNLGEINSSNRRVFQEAIALYTEALNAITEAAALRPRVAWLINRGLAHQYLGAKDKARLDFGRAFEVAPEDTGAKYFHAMALDDAGDLDNAFAVASSIGPSPSIPFLPLYLADMLERWKGLDASIDYLRTTLSSPLPNTLIPTLKQVLVERLIDKEQYDDAQSLSDELIASQSSDVRMLLAAAKIRRAKKNVADADALLEKARRCVSTATPVVHLTLLGDELFSLGRYSEAANAYERVVEPTLATSLTFRLLNSYYEAGRLDQALDVCRKLRAAHGLLRRVSEIESAIYEELGDLPAAQRSCEDYLGTHPDDAEMRIQLAVVSLRQRKNEEVDEFLASLPDWTSLPAGYARQIVNLYTVRGRHREAVKLMYEVRRRFPEGTTQLQYIHTFLFHGQDNLDWLEANEVAVDTAVLLRDAGGKERWYIIEDRADSKIENDELPISHRLAQQVTGKKVGDTVTLSEGSISPEVATIREIKSKYLHAFHQSAETLRERYPEIKGFEAVHLGTGEDGGTPDIQKVLDFVAKRQENIQAIVKVYTENQIPIGALARCLGSNVCEAWSALASRDGRGIVCSIGTLDEREKALECLANDRKRLIVDPVSLMTIHAFDMAADVLRVAGRLGIAQATVDLLTETLHIKSRANAGGGLTLWKEGDHFVKREVTEQEAEEGRSQLERLLQWITDNCDVLSQPQSLRIDRMERQRFTDLIGKESFDTILVASDAGRLLFSDDQRLRAVAKQEFGVDGVWTQPVMMAGVGKGIIEQDNYAKAVIRLVCSGYRLVSLDARTLIEAARIAEWRVAYPYDRVVDALGGDLCDENSAIGVAVQFLYELWNNTISPSATDYLMLRLLDALKRERHLESMVDKMGRGLRQRFLLIPAGGEYFLRVLAAWANMQVW